MRYKANLNNTVKTKLRNQITNLLMSKIKIIAYTISHSHEISDWRINLHQVNATIIQRMNQFYTNTSLLSVNVCLQVPGHFATGKVENMF